MEKILSKENYHKLKKLSETTEISKETWINVILVEYFNHQELITEKNNKEMNEIMEDIDNYLAGS